MLKSDDEDDDDDDDNYESGQQQTSKRLTKDDVNAFNEQINKEEADIYKDFLKNILISKDLVICLDIYTKQMIEKKIIN